MRQFTLRFKPITPEKRFHERRPAQIHQHIQMTGIFGTHTDLTILVLRSMRCADCPNAFNKCCWYRICLMLRLFVCKEVIND